LLNAIFRLIKSRLGTPQCNFTTAAAVRGQPPHVRRKYPAAVRNTLSFDHFVGLRQRRLRHGQAAQSPLLRTNEAIE
jgi:hypothetical protein